MRVAIFEPTGDGHYLAMYGRLIFREMVARGWDVRLVTTEQARDQEGVSVLRGEFGVELQIHFMPNMVATHPKLVVAAWKHAMEVDRLFRDAYAAIAAEGRPDVALLTSSSRLDFSLALGRYPFGSTPMVGFWNGRGFHFSRMGVPSTTYRFDPLYEWAFRRAVRRPEYREVLAVDPIFTRWAHEKVLRGGEKVRYVPEAGMVARGWKREDARHSLGISEAQRVVLLFGMLGTRKGVAEAVRAVAHPSIPERVVLLAAGKQREGVAETFGSGDGLRLREAGRLIEMPGFLSDDDEARAFAAADVVWVGYVGFDNSSGVQFQAALCGLPVLSSINGLLGHFTKEYGIGLAVDPTDTAATAAALVRLTTDESFVRTCSENGLRHAQKHAPENLARAACDACARAVSSTR